MGCSDSKDSVCDTKTDNKGPRGKPDWEKEADRLHEAVEGLGTDETCIVTILARFTNKERQRILKVYKERFQENLLTVLESELSGSYKEVIMALLYSPVAYDVMSLHMAFENQEYDSLVTIIVSSRSDRLNDVKESYCTEYGETVEDELLKLEDKDLGNTLVCLLNADRPLSNCRADEEAAKERATLMFNDGNVLSLFCEPLCRNQLRETLAAFGKLYGINLAEFIDDRSSSLSTLARDALKACVTFNETPPKYFAQEIQKGLNVIIGYEAKLVRLMVSRSEIDLYYIKKEFLSSCSKPLDKAIHSNCRSDYAKLLTIVLELRGQYTESAKKR